MIRLCMSKRQLVYWLSGLTMAPLLLFSTGLVSGLLINSYVPEPVPVVTANQSSGHVYTPSAEIAVLEETVQEDPLENLVESTHQESEEAVEHIENDGFYAVQVGNFTSEKSAWAVTKMLKSKGYLARTAVSRDARSLKVSFKVLVGRYSSYAEAELVKNRYRSEERAQAFVVS